MKQYIATFEKHGETICELDINADNLKQAKTDAQDYKTYEPRLKGAKTCVRMKR